MNVDNTAKYSSLLCDFRQMGTIKQKDSDRHVTQDYRKLISDYKKNISRHLEIARIKAPEFNIFRLLGMSRDEVRTHSSIISELLSPHGSHGQGALFISTFFNICLEKEPENQSLQQILKTPSWKDCSVSKEFFSSDGRMDVVIRNPSIGFFCVIETKVDAIEQSTQLSRYNHHLRSIEQSYPYHSLIFLTRRGSYSISAGTTDYIRLSFREDIFLWLNRVLTLVEANSVKEIVLQYMDIARNL